LFGIVNPIRGGHLAKTINRLTTPATSYCRWISQAASNSDTGNVCGVAVKHQTITFIGLKPGLLTADARMRGA
jgi:NAD(P)H-hydrate repair Nnr-like enzyme with NAD(P)H-hydrate epimerase domain